MMTLRRLWLKWKQVQSTRVLAGTSTNNASPEKAKENQVDIEHYCSSGPESVFFSTTRMQNLTEQTSPRENWWR